MIVVVHRPRTIDQLSLWSLNVHRETFNGKYLGCLSQEVLMMRCFPLWLGPGGKRKIDLVARLPINIRNETWQWCIKENTQVIASTIKTANILFCITFLSWKPVMAEVRLPCRYLEYHLHMADAFSSLTSFASCGFCLPLCVTSRAQNS